MKRMAKIFQQPSSLLFLFNEKRIQHSVGQQCEQAEVSVSRFVFDLTGISVSVVYLHDIPLSIQFIGDGVRIIGSHEDLIVIVGEFS